MSKICQTVTECHTSSRISNKKDFQPPTTWADAFSFISLHQSVHIIPHHYIMYTEVGKLLLHAALVKKMNVLLQCKLGLSAL